MGLEPMTQSGFVSFAVLVILSNDHFYRSAFKADFYKFAVNRFVNSLFDLKSNFQVL